MKKYDNFSINITCVEVGWMDMVFNINEEEIKFSASYLGPNPLVDLINIMYAIYDGDYFDEKGNPWRTWWVDEPGYLKIAYIKKSPTDVLYLTIDYMPFEREDDPNNKQYELKISEQALVDNVCMLTENLICKHGIWGLNEEWCDNDEGLISISKYLALKNNDLQEHRNTFEAEKLILQNIYGTL